MSTNQPAGTSIEDTVRSTDGTAIAYTRTGEGPPVIFVAGATQYRAISGTESELSASLSSRFSVITYDRRGRGESGDTAPYAVEREIEDIAALIHAVGGPAALFGESSGAVLALEAVLHGLPISRLACYEPPFYVYAGYPQRSPDFSERFDALVADGRRGDAFTLFMIEAVGVPAEAAAGITEIPLWPALESVTHTISYDGLIMGDTQKGDPASLDRFQPIAIPTLVMVGSKSPAYQHKAVRRLAEVLPTAQWQTIQGESHQYSAAGIAQSLRDFLSR
jgi:pimeloyl-ACP methyl ester carboxylesterase